MPSGLAKLCVNIDHVATVRQARRTVEPDPVSAALLAELGGAAGITCHLREDRRHVNDDDVRRLKSSVRVRFNLEMAATEEMLAFAEAVRPHLVMLVPENRTEVTTEGGLDVAGSLERVGAATARLKAAGLRVSHFIDPDPAQIGASLEAGADTIELHTGPYANAANEADRTRELAALVHAAECAADDGLAVNAGHGLTLRNVLPVAAIKGLGELHIGHSIVSHALLVGFERAVREMVEAIDRGSDLGRHMPPDEVMRLYGA